MMKMKTKQNSKSDGSTEFSCLMDSTPVPVTPLPNAKIERGQITVSINPILFLGALFLILAWKTAGWWELYRWVLPALGTPWRPGYIFDREEPEPGPRPFRAFTDVSLEWTKKDKQ